MIKKYQKTFNAINVISDYVLIFLSYVIAGLIRVGFMYGDNPNLELAFNKKYLSLIAIFSCFLIITYAFTKLYRSQRVLQLAKEVVLIIFVNTVCFLMLASILYVLRYTDFSRLMLFIFYCISTAVIVTKRIILRMVLRYYRKKGYNIKHIVIVGNGHLAFEYKKSVEKEAHLGFKIAGYVSKVSKENLGKQLGSYENLSDILENNEVDEVVIALEPHENIYMKMVISACEKQGVRTNIIPFYNDYIPSHPSVYVVGNTKLINIRSIPLDNPFNAFYKRAFDILVSLAAIILTSPLMLIIAIGVKLSSPGPILFKQKRIGLNKKPFTMYKFRSMRITDKENTAWTTDNDPRKTKFGALIRKYSCDELPQLFNVLFNSMSIVGPRPEIPHHVEHFKEEIPLYLVRQQVRPGITGWAQVNGFRGDTSIEDRIKYDIWYIENWTWLLDLKILFMTIFGGMSNKEQLVKTDKKDKTTEVEEV